MNTIVSDRLTRGYLQRLERENYLATTSFVVISTICIFWSIFQIGGSNGVNFFYNIMYPLSSAIGACWAFLTAYRTRHGPLRLASHQQLAWLLVGLGLLANCLGGLYYTYLAQTGASTPVPSYADIGFTLFYPLTFVAFLIMPSPPRFRKRIALDAFITTLCILGISWYFFIYTILMADQNAHEGLATIIVVSSYPVWDMLLILAVVMLIQRRTDPILHTSLLIFGIGILFQIWADTSYAYTLALNVYTTGLFYVDPFWQMGFLLFGLSALYQYAALARRAYREQNHPTQAASRAEPKAVLQADKSRPRFFGQSMLIYSPLTLLLVVMLYSEFTESVRSRERALFLVILTAIAGVLVAVRYTLATRENELLLQEREQSRQAAERLRLLGVELTNILELDRLFERIVTLATSQLGFDAAILLLIEDYELPRDTQSRLLVLAAAAAAQEVASWRIQGTQLAKCQFLLEQEKDVNLAMQAPDIPPELDGWRREKGIGSAFFVPLLYQGQFLGNICFVSHTEQSLSQPYLDLARAYTQQIAVIIEHTRLYQTRLEQERFAQAMANIATRLNAAVVEPTEIYQLICTEAANALRADYVLLYEVSDDEYLLPLATYLSEEEPAMALADWPPIRQHEYEGQALTSLQPVLMQMYSDYTLLNTKSNASLEERLRSRSSGIVPAYAPARMIDGYPTSLVREKLVRRYVRTAILAPLIAGGDALGLLVLARSHPPGNHEKTSFARSDLPHVQDFAEQAAVALTNAQLYQRLQELDQLKDQFMITASHELRTPLTSVQGYIELIAQYDDVMPSEQRKEFLQKAQRSCDELVVLLQNVMDASCLEVEAGIRSTHSQRVLIREMVESVINLIEPSLTQEKREVHLAIPAQLAVQADPTRLRQVLVNLSVNALKYSPSHTPIAFSARAGFDHNRYAVISVTDKGKGIAPQDQTRLFERFVRLESDINSSVRGSGLGLYISRRLIEAMGGKIWIESSGIPGEGTTFHIQLPMA